MANIVRSFRVKSAKNQRGFRRFLTKIENNPPKGLDKLAETIDKEVWTEVDCLACANCCKTMSPTFTPKDLKRIAPHFNMTIAEFKEKWLYKDKIGDWMNTSQPCQFLKSDNKCSIYEIRPDDCRGFPHLTRRRMPDYIHVHKQNIAYCPATLKMVEKMKERLG
jgi:uncharacterized protein